MTITIHWYDVPFVLVVVSIGICGLAGAVTFLLDRIITRRDEERERKQRLRLVIGGRN